MAGKQISKEQQEIISKLLNTTLDENNKIGGMFVVDTVTSRGADVFLLPIKTFSKQLENNKQQFSEAESIESLSKSARRSEGKKLGFSILLVRLACEIKLGKIPSNIEYAVYIPKYGVTVLCKTLEFNLSNGRRVSNPDDLYVIFMRKFVGKVYLGTKTVIYDNGNDGYDTKSYYVVLAKYGSTGGTSLKGAFKSRLY